MNVGFLFDKKTSNLITVTYARIVDIKAKRYESINIFWFKDNELIGTRYTTLDKPTKHVLLLFNKGELCYRLENNIDPQDENLYIQKSKLLLKKGYEKLDKYRQSRK